MVVFVRAGVEGGLLSDGRDRDGYGKMPKRVTEQETVTSKRAAHEMARLKKRSKY